MILDPAEVTAPSPVAGACCCLPGRGARRPSGDNFTRLNLLALAGYGLVVALSTLGRRPRGRRPKTRFAVGGYPFGGRNSTCSVRSASRGAPSKIPYIGFSPVRLQATSPPDACLRALLGLAVAALLPLCVGLRLRRCCASGRRVKCVRTSPVAAAVCIGLRVWLCRTRFPRHCVLAGALRHTVDRPRVLSFPAVMLSAGSSVLRPDVPGSGPRSDFTPCAYTDRPAVRGRSRRGPSPSQLCPVHLGPVPPPLRRRDPRVPLPVSSSGISAFAQSCEARLPVSPSPHSSWGEFSRRGSDRFMLRPGSSLAPLGGFHPIGRRGLYPRSFRQDGRPIPASDSLRA